MRSAARAGARDPKAFSRGNFCWRAPEFTVGAADLPYGLAAMAAGSGLAMRKRSAQAQGEVGCA